jgi:hypothetical protein
MEREHELERMAAGVPNGPATAEDSHRVTLNLLHISKGGAALPTERLALHENAMHIS